MWIIYIYIYDITITNIPLNPHYLGLFGPHITTFNKGLTLFFLGLMWDVQGFGTCILFHTCNMHRLRELWWVFSCLLPFSACLRLEWLKHDILQAEYQVSDMSRVATVMEKSWNFWNFEIFWNFWKSHGILTKNGQGHGKVIEFLNLSKKSWKNHGILQTNFLFSWIGAATRQLFKIQLTCMSIKRSWNFVIWSLKIHGKVMEFCRDNFVATLESNCSVHLLVQCILSPIRKWNKKCTLFALLALLCMSNTSDEISNSDRCPLLMTINH